MNFPNGTLDFVAASAAAALAVGAVARNSKSLTARWFAAGMAWFCLEAIFDGLSLNTASVDDAGKWQIFGMMARACSPVCWLAFSALYCRGNPSPTLRPWRPLLLAGFLLPLVPVLFQQKLLIVFALDGLPGHFGIHFYPAAKVLNGFLLVFPILVLMNIERTFRTAVGTIRWRIKFVLIGVAIIFGARFYTRSEAMLFSGYNLSLVSLETGALLIGSAFIVAGYLRGGFGEIDLYPSRAVLQMSFTVLLAGGYLFLVGVLAPIVARLGVARFFPLAALFVLVATVLLALLLLSERVRQGSRLFISRHFKRPEHDFRDIWTRFSRTVAPLLDENQLCSAACRLLSETFNVLSVSIWRLDKARECLVRVASTTGSAGTAGENGVREVSAKGFNKQAVPRLARTFDLEHIRNGWTDHLRTDVTSCFRTGGHRFCVPLIAGEEPLGVMLLADRVGGVPFTAEELDLLACIGDQVAASLTNVQLAREVVAAKEVQAFQTMSAFFVHDLKNTASALGLMLQNLPVHFDDPAFREDMLRGIRSATERINHLISSLSGFRGELQLKFSEIDLNKLITDTLQQLNGSVLANVSTRLNPIPHVSADVEKIQSVFNNLLLNARDAAGPKGEIVVETRADDDNVSFSVSDNGVGMSETFIRESLFRPFQTTKKKGLGIGMFQARMIIEAHRGTIEVHSTPGVGTVFQVTVPVTKK